MPRSYVTLAEHPTDMVRLACSRAVVGSIQCYECGQKCQLIPPNWVGCPLALAESITLNLFRRFPNPIFLSILSDGPAVQEAIFAGNHCGYCRKAASENKAGHHTKREFPHVSPLPRWVS